MAEELKAVVVHLKSLDQDIPDPIIVGGGDANSRTLRVIFTQEAQAQLTPETKVYLKWHHKELDVDGYNSFKHCADSYHRNNIWEIKWPLAMLSEGNVLCCIELVDRYSIAQSVSFLVHVLQDPHSGEHYVVTDDFTEFQKACIALATLEEDVEAQFKEWKWEFLSMKETIDVGVEEAKAIADKAIGIAEEAKEIAQQSTVKPEDVERAKKQAIYISKEYTDKKIKEIGAENAYDAMYPIKDYLYETFYSKLDYAYAREHFKQDRIPFHPRACTSIRKGKWYGRNFDWLYDENASFVVHTERYAKHYATLGVSGCVDGLTDQIAKSGVYNELYKLLPFFIVDGINEQGVVVSMNVVPLEKGITKHTTPTEEKETELSMFMIPRFILDNFDNAHEAIVYLRKHVEIFGSKKLADMGYDLHFMVADENNTFLMEFINSQIVMSSMNETGTTNVAGKPYMTNFHLKDVIFDENGKVIINHDGSHINDSNVELHGQGLERYNLIVDQYEGCDTKVGMTALMQQLLYTNAYRDETIPFWYTEFVDGDLDIAAPIDDYDSVIARTQKAFKHRTRNPHERYYGTWQTVHSGVYDIDSRKLYLTVQEEPEEFEFEIESGSSGTKDYPQLTNKPQINGVTLLGNKSLAELGVSAVGVSNDYADLDNKPEFAEVALSGDYEDLENKPEIRNVPEFTDADENKVLKIVGNKAVWHDEDPVRAAALVEAIVVSNPIGEYEKDYVIPVGTPLEDILRTMLTKYIPPTPPVTYNIYAGVFDVESSELDADYIVDHGEFVDVTDIAKAADVPHFELYTEDVDTPKGVFIAIPEEKDSFRIKVVTPINGSFVITEDFKKQRTQLTINDLVYNWWVFEPAQLYGNEEYEISFR